MTIYNTPERRRALQRQIIHSCFNGNKERDCDDCPAHHTTEDGRCCFGDPNEFDGDDDDCEKCVYSDECSEAADEFVQEQEEEEIERQAVRQSYYQPYKHTIKPRPTTTRIRTKRPGIVVRPKKNGNGLVQPGRKRIASADPVQLTMEDGVYVEPMFPRFLKESARGGLVGLFEMAAEFLRIHPFP